MLSHILVSLSPFCFIYYSIYKLRTPLFPHYKILGFRLFPLVISYIGAAILILLSYLHLDVNSYLPTYPINRNLIHRVYFLHFYFLSSHKFVSNKLGYYLLQYYYRSLIIYIRNGRSCLHSVDMENYVWLYGSINSNYLSEKWIQLLTSENNVRKSASYWFRASQIACTRRYVLRCNISCFMTWISLFLFWDCIREKITNFNPLNSELNPICYLLALLGAHHFLHVSRIWVKSLTLRLLMSYIYGAPILDVSRSHTTTQHSR